MDLLVLCVACLTVFVNCLVKQFEISLSVDVILFMNVMEVFVGLPKHVCCACNPSVHLDVLSIGCVCVCRKLSSHLGV